MSGATALVLAAAAVSVGAAAPHPMSGGFGGHAMPKCTPATGPVVWLVPSTKKYYLKYSPQWGGKNGSYVCRATAVARGATVGSAYPGPGGYHTTSGGSHDAHGSHSMPMTMTMAPRPMPSPNAAGSGNPMSGNQGNTGAPGAGGQIPNNPASTSNNSPSPSPRP